MQNLYSPVEVYPFLQQLCLVDQTEQRKQYISRLNELLQKEQHKLQLEPEETELHAYVVAREQIFSNITWSYFKEETNKIIEANLKVENSFEILAMNTHLIDGIIHVAFDFVLADLPFLRTIQMMEVHKELSFKERVLPEKKEKLVILEKHLEELSQKKDDKESQQMLSYYQGVYKSLEEEIEEYHNKSIELNEQSALLDGWEMDQEHILKCLVIFARGGYGRGELSFASDRDIGYCLNPQFLNAGEFELFKLLIIRIEHLLNQTGIETAHQYFEINEDLFRFTEPEAIHTISSILESRVILGNNNLLERLKRQFFEILPYETYVLDKLETYQNAVHPGLNKMDLKEEYGGLRSIQIPLWVASATFGLFTYHTAELLALLIEKHILSARQALQLSQALEFFYELRNFIGAAKEHYFDEEAKSVGCYLEDHSVNVITDNLEKLYLLKKQRFSSFDDFDRYRLRLVYGVQELSQLMLNRLLDRTIVRTFSSFQATVNLGQQSIIEIRAIEGLPQTPLPLIFNNPIILLDLFIYIGNSDYSLSNDLKDNMADVIRTITPTVIQTYLTEIRERFSAIMLSPHADKALKTMFEIYDPSNTEQNIDTLIGRFIPACNKMRYLLRNLNYHQYSVCEHTLEALRYSNEELDYLKKKYTELYQYLTPKHILALKWSILFHDIGKIDPKTRHQISGTSIAVNALEGIGYDDEDIFNLVNSLIYHHMTIVQLSKAPTYLDQAMLRFFEVADRDLIQMILLFLINISDYTAVSEVTSKERKILRNFFDQTYQAYLEIRISTDISNPIELINLYLHKKKKEQEAATRIDILIRNSLYTDLTTALFRPLSDLNPKEHEQLQTVKDELEQYWKYLKMGNLDYDNTEKYTAKFIQTINQYVSSRTIDQLTAEIDKTFNWFFSAYPNRFLLSKSPDLLAQKILEFTKFEERPIFSVTTSPRGKVTGILIYVHEHPKIFSRIAYGMSVKNINIKSGKMNKVIFENGKVGYCYYFEVSSNEMIFPKALEQIILEGSLPELKKVNFQNALFKSKLRIKFLGNDNKGYDIVQQGNQFIRRNQKFRLVRITTVDAPLLYYKITEAFDRIGVDFQQALITTTGNQVNDFFYVTEQECNILMNSKFEEILKLRFSEPDHL
ncbi:MAG: protein-PII uridylyltransferase [SAR324 cluster bacterium]|nr:protein-PII uridylyltransferase [SAR324 cluster bacterium]